MRVAIISDIHGNLEAFLEVLADIDQTGVDAIHCLGDIVGYGPDPEAVVQLLRRKRIPSVMGNHELALLSDGYFSRLNDSTKKSLLITRSLLTEESVRYLETLPETVSAYDARLVHGCPAASVTVYLFDPSDRMLEKLFNAFPERICFVGHTHHLALFGFDGSEVSRDTLTEGIVPLVPDTRYIINVGSVGQPRDRQNKNAKYVVWDTEQHTIEVRFVAYTASITAEKIIKRGFPEYNATRLL